MANEPEVFNRDGKFKAKLKVRKKAHESLASVTEPKHSIPTTGKRTSKVTLRKPALIDLKANSHEIRIKNTIVTVLKPDDAFLADISSRISLLEKVIIDLDERHDKSED